MIDQTSYRAVSRQIPLNGQRLRLGQTCLTVSYPSSGIHRGALIPFRVDLHNEGAYTAQQVRVLINLPPGLGLLAGMLGLDGRRALRTKEIVDQQGHCVSATIGTVEPRESLTLRGTFVIPADLPTGEQQFAVHIVVSADDLPDELLETTLVVGNGSASGKTSAIVWSRPVTVAPPKALVIPLHRELHTRREPFALADVAEPAPAPAMAAQATAAAIEATPSTATAPEPQADQGSSALERPRLRRALLVARKVAAVGRMGWWKHVMALRTLSPDAVAGTHEANAAYRSAIDRMDHALARAFMALFAPGFSPTPAWIASLYAADPEVEADLRSAHALGAEFVLPAARGSCFHRGTAGELTAGRRGSRRRRRAASPVPERPVRYVLARSHPSHGRVSPPAPSERNAQSTTR